MQVILRAAARGTHLLLVQPTHQSNLDGIQPEDSKYQGFFLRCALQWVRTLHLREQIRAAKCDFSEKVD
jgi:hypothetical protein